MENKNPFLCIPSNQKEFESNLVKAISILELLVLAFEHDMIATQSHMSSAYGVLNDILLLLKNGECYMNQLESKPLKE